MSTAVAAKAELKINIVKKNVNCAILFKCDKLIIANFLLNNFAGRSHLYFIKEEYCYKENQYK